MTTSTYRQLQTELKMFRDEMGYTLEVKLNASADVLSAEWERITGLIEESETEIETETETEIEIETETETEIETETETETDDITQSELIEGIEYKGQEIDIYFNPCNDDYYYEINGEYGDGEYDCAMDAMENAKEFVDCETDDDDETDNDDDDMEEESEIELVKTLEYKGAGICIDHQVVGYKGVEICIYHQVDEGYTFEVDNREIYQLPRATYDRALADAKYYADKYVICDGSYDIVREEKKR